MIRIRTHLSNFPQFSPPPPSSFAYCGIPCKEFWDTFQGHSQLTEGIGQAYRAELRLCPPWHGWKECRPGPQPSMETDGSPPGIHNWKQVSHMLLPLRPAGQNPPGRHHCVSHLDTHGPNAQRTGNKHQQAMDSDCKPGKKETRL